MIESNTATLPGIQVFSISALALPYPPPLEINTGIVVLRVIMSENLDNFESKRKCSTFPSF